ncbi:MAG: 50S ribosomal protein L15 [Bacteriovoracaceae bacterium]|nr:50S ribosomal protein L15 [Bacteriovoracaceae bacterium]
MLKLNTLKSPKGANKNTKRLGRGQGSGQGTQAGKGHKGQKARSGGHHPLGFEGGQMPLYRRLPKKGFANEPFRKEFAVVNLCQLEKKFKAGEEITRENLIERGLLKGINKRHPIKILARGDFSLKLNFKDIESFSDSAKKIIEKVGGKIITATKVA